MSRTCSVCEHPERVAIEATLSAGESNRRIAAQYELSEAAVRRHRADHASQGAQEAQQEVPAHQSAPTDQGEPECTCGNISSFIDDEGVRRCFLCRRPFRAA